jgi:hypothetical protein
LVLRSAISTSCERRSVSSFSSADLGRCQRSLGLGASGLRGSDATRSLSQLLAKALQLQILRLEHDEVFEIGVHRCLLSPE